MKHPKRPRSGSSMSISSSFSSSSKPRNTAATTTSTTTRPPSPISPGTRHHPIFWSRNLPVLTITHHTTLIYGWNLPTATTTPWWWFFLPVPGVEIQNELGLLHLIKACLLDEKACSMGTKQAYSGGIWYCVMMPVEQAGAGKPTKAGYALEDVKKRLVECMLYGGSYH